MYKILLVEDDRAIAQAICRHITAWGLEIKAASNFRDILAEFSAYEPHLLRETGMRSLLLRNMTPIWC